MPGFACAEPVNWFAISSAFLEGENVPHAAMCLSFEPANFTCMDWNNSVIPFPSRDRGGSTLLEKVD